MVYCMPLHTRRNCAAKQDSHVQHRFLPPSSPRKSRGHADIHSSEAARDQTCECTAIPILEGKMDSSSSWVCTHVMR